ncbi:unnamed protein product [Protopolystoma xenopodis]|uniref:Uncharacterized protein n=1 Tax=Protopolystoma xenopodis TaxID=117903 RepID=A0A3S5BVZ5_9PLAT|nr:unnamed protein product [Protopolystoma xenopodis]
MCESERLSLELAWADWLSAGGESHWNPVDQERKQEGAIARGELGKDEPTKNMPLPRKVKQLKCVGERNCLVPDREHVSSSSSTKSFQLPDAPGTTRPADVHMQVMQPPNG